MLIRVFSFICKTSFEMLVLKRNLNYQYENKYDVLENTRKKKNYRAFDGMNGGCFFG